LLIHTIHMRIPLRKMKDPFIVFVVACASLLSVVLLASGLDSKDITDDFEYSNFYRLKVHENLYDYINDTVGTVVIFIQTWCEDSKHIRSMLNESFDNPVIVVDERHPDATLTRKFPSMYIFDGAKLRETTLGEVLLE
jgi:hypothetical protein